MIEQALLDLRTLERVLAPARSNCAIYGDGIGRKNCQVAAIIAPIVTKSQASYDIARPAMDGQQHSRLDAGFLDAAFRGAGARR